MFDAILLLSYGAPETPEQIEPFLTAILAGRRVPSARVAAVRARYESVDGRSPLAGECRRFLENLQRAIARQTNAPALYWGNLFAPPTLEDAVERIARDKRRAALVFVSSAFGAGAVCLRYRLDAARARVKVASAPSLVFAPPFFDRPEFRRALADSILETIAWDQLDAHPFAEQPEQRLLLFTAHSTPVDDAALAQYPEQLAAACNLVLHDILAAPSRATIANAPPARTELPDFTRTAPLARELAPELLACLREQALDAALVYQSRSGAPNTPWLEPDANRFLQEYQKRRPALKRVIVVPIGFFFENMETVYDLDVELRATCERLNLSYRRARCVGASERVARMVAEFARLEPETLPQCPALDSGRCDFSCRAPRRD